MARGLGACQRARGSEEVKPQKDDLLELVDPLGLLGSLTATRWREEDQGDQGGQVRGDEHFGRRSHR